MIAYIAYLHHRPWTSLVAGAVIGLVTAVAIIVWEETHR